MAGSRDCLLADTITSGTLDDAGKNRRAVPRGSRMFRTIEWTEDGVRMIDQLQLPNVEVYRTCKDYKEVAEAIRTMVIRGAPAIGVAAAMGVALGMQSSQADNAA